MFWFNGEDWRVRIGLGAARPLGFDEALEVAGIPFRTVRIPLSLGSRTPTRAADRARLHIVARYDAVHLHRDGSPVTSLPGQHARLVSELALAAGPIPWEALARELWVEEERHRLRHPLDVLLSKLRGRLRSAGIREDLVHSSGAGTVELLLLPGDTVDAEGC